MLSDFIGLFYSRNLSQLVEVLSQIFFKTIFSIERNLMKISEKPYYFTKLSLLTRLQKQFRKTAMIISGAVGHPSDAFQERPYKNDNRLGIIFPATCLLKKYLNMGVYVG